jgi:hypothetical protein
MASGPDWAQPAPKGATILYLIHKSKDLGPVDRFVEVGSKRIVKDSIGDDELGLTVIDMVTELTMHDMYEHVKINGVHPVEPHVPAGQSVYRVGQFADQ